MIQPYTTSVTVTADRDWLASRHGTDSTETITLDLNKFTKGTHYVEPSPGNIHGFVRSGVPVGRITTSGLYGVYDPAATDGRAVLAGLVYAEAAYTPGTTKVPAALFWHGTAKVQKIPGGIDPSKIVANPAGAQIRFLAVGA
ncbi:head decoration protein [Streptomyces sp. NBC_00237]|uniref:head decoration protein n=1 Tax=Streptomyces sp. NBC_00237 TaxID=2975687 RepID=UPI002259155D|nr:head decoration protein [Streptomyces sp. NBC_00237]MCX5206761.1 head decoration protein [Streptomyces sp. NBC_00237]